MPEERLIDRYLLNFRDAGVIPQSNGGDILFHEQREDIDAPTDKYCVYTTAWNAYKAMYKLDKGIEITEDKAKLARSNATNNGVKTSGLVYDYNKLAKSFNKTFDTNYKYSYTEEYAKSVPNDLSPRV